MDGWEANTWHSCPKNMFHVLLVVTECCDSRQLKWEYEYRNVMQRASRRSQFLFKEGKAGALRHLAFASGSAIRRRRVKT